jgi:hypothetical protein
MWQNYIFGMHWKHGDKMYYDELSSESKDKAAGYFIDNCRDCALHKRKGNCGNKREKTQKSLFGLGGLLGRFDAQRSSHCLIKFHVQL